MSLLAMAVPQVLRRMECFLPLGRLPVPSSRLALMFMVSSAMVIPVRQRHHRTINYHRMCRFETCTLAFCRQDELFML